MNQIVYEAMSNMVKEFYFTFGLPTEKKERNQLRYDLFVEEYSEFGLNFIKGDSVEQMDAICDMLYIHIGTEIEYNISRQFNHEMDIAIKQSIKLIDALSILFSDSHGICFNVIYEIIYEKIYGEKTPNFYDLLLSCFTEVHRSNMSKCSTEKLEETDLWEVVHNQDVGLYYYINKTSGKVMKPNLYSKPNLKSIIEQFSVDNNVKTFTFIDKK